MLPSLTGIYKYLRDDDGAYERKQEHERVNYRSLLLPVAPAPQINNKPRKRKVRTPPTTQIVIFELLSHV